ncbi:MBL fold metallo-hydrolase [Patescibacteria group bacterium]|nr:MBL fold metallo-hydrolase [Patescibacteria group bacterium]
MKLTKYIHSCVFLEKNGEKLLIDPGIFTFMQDVTPETFKDVRTILITHNHPDHVDPKALKIIVEMSGATIVTNEEVQKALEAADVQTTFVTGLNYETSEFKIEGIAAAHANILSDTLPKNTAYLINQVLLVPGDSFSETLTQLGGVEVLLLPIMAPWMTELSVAEFARLVHPKRIVPIHDGYAKDFFLQNRYENFKKNFSKDGMVFEMLAKPGDSIEI